MIHLDLEIRRGAFRTRAEFQTGARVSGLFGPTGSGKTTLLMAMAGLVRPQRGRIAIGDVVLYDSDRGVHLPPEKRGVGVVFQEGRLFPHLSVRENLVYSGRSRTVRFEEIVHLLDLEALLDRRVGELSGGQSRLVAVGRALLSDPRLLLLDEPLTGLDPGRRRRVLAYLIRLKESIGIEMLYVSHVFSDFMALVDETVLLSEGRILARGTPEAVMGQALGEEEAGGLETLLSGIVESAHETGEIDARCDAALLHLSVPGARAGDPVYVTVRAEDVLLGTGPVPATTARNVLPGTVASLQEIEGKVLVALDAGTRVWAEITEDSRNRLNLRAGSEVYALIKSSALRGVVIHPGLR